MIDPSAAGPGPKGLNRISGFTLLELIVVLFIISLLSAVTLPSFFGTAADSIKTDAKKIASLVRYLNDSAIYSKKTYLLQFDLKERAIAWNGPEGDKTEKFLTLSGLNLQSRGTVTDGQVTVFFSPMGLRENLDIFLREADKGSKVIFNSLSGRVKIENDE